MRLIGVRGVLVLERGAGAARVRCAHRGLQSRGTAKGTRYGRLNPFPLYDSMVAQNAALCYTLIHRADKS